MSPIDPPHSFHLLAAQGWLELGNLSEAAVELEKIGPELARHPAVLEVQWLIHSERKEWEKAAQTAEAQIAAAPDLSTGWVHRSYALHELRRTREAYDALRTAADRFQEDWVIPYNLACYCAQLGHLEEARDWLRRASLRDETAVREAAAQDPDLAPLRNASEL